MKNVRNFSKEIKKDLKETNRKSTETITIRVTSEEKKRIKRLASACKISQTQLIKKLIGGADLKAIPPEYFYQMCLYLGEVRDEFLTRYADHEADTKQLLMLKDALSDFKNGCELFYNEGVFGFAYEKCRADFLSEMEQSHAMFGED